MSKYVKKLAIDTLERKLDGIDDFVIVDLMGVNANDNNEMRLELRKNGILIQTVKNTLARNLLKEKGLEPTAGLFAGPSAIAYGGNDVVDLSKQITEWADKFEKFSIKGGVVDRKFVDDKGVVAVSKMPGRAELLATVAGCLMGPGATLAAALQGPGRTIASQIKTIAEPEGGEG